MSISLCDIYQIGANNLYHQSKPLFATQESILGPIHVHELDRVRRKYASISLTTSYRFLRIRMQGAQNMKLLKIKLNFIKFNCTRITVWWSNWNMGKYKIPFLCPCQPMRQKFRKTVLIHNQNVVCIQYLDIPSFFGVSSKKATNFFVNHKGL